MTSFDRFDPRVWVGTWFDVAASATAWWLDPSSWADVTDVWKLGDRLVAQVVEGVARRFTGARVEVSHEGRPVVLTLSSVSALEPAGADHGADVAFKLRDVAWGEVLLGVVEGVARGARMRPGLPAVLRVDGVELTVAAPAEALLASVGPDPESDWSLAVLPDGRAEVRHRRLRRVAAEVEPTVVDGGLRADLRAIRIGGRRFGLPGWFSFARALPPPELPGGARLLSLAYADACVHLSLSVPGFARDVDLRPLQRALNARTIDSPISF